MSTTEQRKKNAVLGALVADAATMPLHWIYAQFDLLTACVDKEAPEFNAEAKCPFYKTADFPGHYAVGSLSVYGEQMEALVRIAATVDLRDGNALAVAFAEWCKGYTGRKDHAINDFEKNVSEGKKYPETGCADHQAQVFYKATIGCAAGLGTDLDALIRFHQNDDVAMDVATLFASILNAVIGGADPLTAIVNAESTCPPALLDSYKFAMAYLKAPTYDVMIAWGVLNLDKLVYPKPIFGTSCQNPQALIRTLHVLANATSYEDGIRRNLLVGGDNCSTAMGIGAILAAHHGVPASWVARTTGGDTFEALAAAIVK